MSLRKEYQEKLHVAEMRIARERDTMQAEREEMQIRVGMIERAYKRDMKHLERIRSELNIKNSIILDHKKENEKRQRSSEIESRNTIFDRALEKSKQQQATEGGVKLPNYGKIATRKKKEKPNTNVSSNAKSDKKPAPPKNNNARQSLSTSPSNSQAFASKYMRLMNQEKDTEREADDDSAAAK